MVPVEPQRPSPSTLPRESLTEFSDGTSHPGPLLPDDRVEVEFQKALLDRPSLGIRLRLVLGFLIIVAVTAGITVTSWLLLSSVERRLRVLVVVDRLTIEVQQARRFEKDYFLYGTNLPDALDHARQARQLLVSHMRTGEPDATLGNEGLAAFVHQVDRYEELLALLSAGGRDAAPNAGNIRRGELEASVREHGAGITSTVLDMATSERRSVENMLAVAKRVPMVFLAVSVILTLGVANFLARQMLGPLTRLVQATQRIAAGDFSPLAPARRYRDEFSDLAMGINRMTHELERRYQILVESQKLRAVGTLTAGIAHELNNPLNNITLTATTLKQFRSKLNEAEHGEMLDDLVTQADRAQAIVRNLLDFTRQSEARMEPLDLRRLVDDVVSLAQTQVKFTGSSVEVDVPPDLPTVHGDRNLLSQVFLNLLLNALDAVQKGGRIHVSARRAAEPGFVSVDVGDNGSGIPAHIIGSIFDPFFTTKATGQGTGLGLSMSRGIVRQHGGELRAQSVVNEGSTFSVLLPVTMVVADLSSPPARGDCSGTPEGGQRPA
ncbi:MAG: ATP-binding protein [Acidobacteria bacterium]|nr:ATP-binding protein [Acidobacteriota bacterium]